MFSLPLPLHFLPLLPTGPLLLPLPPPEPPFVSGACELLHPAREAAVREITITADNNLLFI